MSQSIFSFEQRHDYSPENFLVSTANREAFDAVTGDWPAYALSIHGPKGSGKTYLANIARNSGIEVIEDVTSANNQVELFHKLNETKERGAHVLLTSEQPLKSIGFILPDLTSRLSAINSIHIDTPDNQLFYLLFARYFAARQLKIGDDVINFLATRVERSFTAALQIVDQLDKLSLEQKRNITIPLVKTILAGNA